VIFEKLIERPFRTPILVSKAFHSEETMTQATKAPRRRDDTEAGARRRGRLKRAIAGTAPGLAHALGGPLAGAAVEALSKAIFGAGAPAAGPADEAVLAEAVERAGPKELQAIYEAELSFRKALAEADLGAQRIAAADRADARARQRALGDLTPSLLGGLIIGGFFIVLAAMVTRRLPPGAETEFSIMLGALATMTAAVVNYFFGSSAGSKEKTRLLNHGPDGSPRP